MLTSSKRVFAEDYVAEGIPFYRGGEISQKKNGEPIEDLLFISQKHYDSIKKSYGIHSKGDILITAVGTIGNSYLVEKEEFYFKDGNIIWLKDFIASEYRFFIYDFLQSKMFRSLLNSLYIGSTQIALTIAGLSGIKVNIPALPMLKKYATRSSVFRKEIQRNQKELLGLHNLTKLLLAKGA
jgi:type I restriction enzyme S subunit